MERIGQGRGIIGIGEGRALKILMEVVGPCLCQRPCRQRFPCGVNVNGDVGGQEGAPDVHGRVKCQHGVCGEIGVRHDE